MYIFIKKVEIYANILFKYVISFVFFTFGGMYFEIYDRTHTLFKLEISIKKLFVLKK